MRTIKSRWSFWGLMLVLGCLFFYVITFAQVRFGEIPQGTDSVDVSVEMMYGTVMESMNMNVFWQQIMLSFAMVYMPLFLVINTTFMACDYYKFKLFINFEGAVSKIKIILADCSALVVSSLVLAVVTGLLMSSGMLFGDTENMLVTMTRDYIASLLSVFLDLILLSLMTYMFSQLTRNKALSATFTLVFVIFISAVTSFINGYLLGRSEALNIHYDYDAYMSISSPANYIGMAISDSDVSPIRVGLMIVSIISFAFQSGLLMVLSMIFAVRRREA